MTVEIWLECAHHPAFRAGGWAYVRRTGAETVGMAGGAKTANAEANMSAGLAAALKDVPAGAVLHTALAFPPEELAAHKVTVRRLAAPHPFVQAWADLARDKAKTGAFASPIPKPNLAKFSA